MAKDKEETKQLSLRIPARLHQKFKTEAARRGDSMTAIITRCMECYVAQGQEGGGEEK